MGLKNYTTEALLEELVERGAKLYLCDSYKGWEVQIKKKYDKGREPFILPEGYRVLAIEEDRGELNASDAGQENDDC